MSDRHEPVIRPPIAFAEEGASAQESPNSLAAFALAQRLGATGLDTNVWLDADANPVLASRGVVRHGWRRRSIAQLAGTELPDDMVSLHELYTDLGVDLQLAITLGDEAMIGAVVDVALHHEQITGRPVLNKLWLCHDDLACLAAWRTSYPDVRLVDTTRLQEMEAGPERRAAQLSSAGIDAVKLPYSDWTGGLVVLFRRFEVLGFGCAAPHDRMLDDLLRMGVDAVGSTHVERMADAMRRAGW